MGIITGVHGIHGEVVIKSYTADPLDIKSYGPLSDERDERQFEFGKVRISQKGVVARLKGIADRNSAETLKGTALFVEHAQLPKPRDEDEFYFTDLIGLKVVLADGTDCGTVTGVYNFGAGDLIEIQANQTPKSSKRPASEVYLFDKKTIPEIDIAAGHIVFNPPIMIETPDE
ncbi:MAG: 16S rRNA processing protein RimM [bacterium]|nr:16S rRNA processing protein RimM [bacterium]